MLSVSHVRKWQNEATGQMFAALFSGTARWIYYESANLIKIPPTFNTRDAFSVI